MGEGRGRGKGNFPEKEDIRKAENIAHWLTLLCESVEQFYILRCCFDVIVVVAVAFVAVLLFIPLAIIEKIVVVAVA